MGSEKIKEVVGDSFEDLSVADMENIQGAGDVDAETASLVISLTAVTTAVSAVVSRKKC